MRILFLFIMMHVLPSFCLAQIIAEGFPKEKKSLVELAGKVDMSCVDLKVIGTCPTPTPPYVGVLLQYREPSLLMETVKEPGDYIIREYGVLASKVLVFLKNDRTSTASSQSLGGSNLQFNETHLYDFPLKFIEQAVTCGPLFGDNTIIRFLSELDSMAWRQGRMLDAGAPLTLGNWGPLFPRVGFLVHFSSLIASATTCVRAVNIIGIGPDLIQDRVQMVYPHRTPCMMIGADMPEDLHAKDGRYAWIYWKHRKCCRAALPS